MNTEFNAFELLLPPLSCFSLFLCCFFDVFFPFLLSFGEHSEKIPIKKKATKTRASSFVFFFPFLLNFFGFFSLVYESFHFLFLLTEPENSIIIFISLSR
jgi:hypothetical protein